MKNPPSSQKLRGGYYTPMPITRFLANWAIHSPDMTILEPSAGDGNFMEAAAERLISLGVPLKSIPKLLLGIEIDSAESNRARSRMKELDIPGSGQSVLNGDFFQFCRKQLGKCKIYDAIVGNPPFIRYQNFPEEQRTIAFGLMEDAGLHPTGLTNAWVPFLVGSTLLLGDHGRIGMVAPAELLQVGYAAELRQFLSEKFSRLTLIAFRRLLFGDAQQEVVLLLGEKNGDERRGIRTVEIDDIGSLYSYKHPSFSDGELKPLDHTTEKWTQYFLSTEEIILLRKLRQDPHLKRLGELTEINVGIVTGLNEFFVLNMQKVAEYKIAEHTVPIVSRSAHLPGIVFSNTDWKVNADNNYRAFLLNAPDAPFTRLPASLRKYIGVAEKLGWNKGYKCRIRDRWYVVPSAWAPDAFLLRQVNGYPRMILNNSDATCTDTIHRVKFRNGIAHQTVATAFLNSLTFAFSEVIGRSYGGGVLELEPREAETLPIPLQRATKLDTKHINKLILEGSISEVLDINDAVLLCEGLGLNQRQVSTLRGIWKKLRDRRNGRRVAATSQKINAQVAYGGQ